MSRNDAPTPSALYCTVPFVRIIRGILRGWKCIYKATRRLWYVTETLPFICATGATEVVLTSTANQPPLPTLPQNQPPLPQDQLPLPALPHNQLPLPALPHDQLPLPALPHDQLPLPALPHDQLPLPALPHDQLPLPALPHDQLPLPALPHDQLPLPALPHDQLPLPALPHDQLPLPALPHDQLPLPALPHDQLPLPALPHDQLPLPALPHNQLPLPQNQPPLPQNQPPQPRTRNSTNLKRVLKPKRRSLTFYDSNDPTGFGDGRYLDVFRSTADDLGITSEVSIIPVHRICEVAGHGSGLVMRLAHLFSGDKWLKGHLQLEHKGYDPSVSLPQLISSLQKPLLLPLSDLQLCSDQHQNCLCLRSKSSNTQWLFFSDHNELRLIRQELIKLLQMDLESLEEPSPGLPSSLLNSWEHEGSRSVDGGFTALLFLSSSSSSSSESLHPLLQNVLSPAPHLPCLLPLSPTALFVVHSREENCCCDSPHHKLSWNHSVELLLCGHRLLLLFPLPEDGASFLGKLRLQRALPQTKALINHQGGPSSGEQCCCSHKAHSDSLSSLSTSLEEMQPSPHLTPGLTPGLKLLSGLNAQQLQPVFHKHIALSGGEELRQVLWLSVVLYKSPEVELTCLLLLSANAIYFLLEDSASSLGPPPDLDVLECGDSSVCLCCCLSAPLSQIQSVNVGLFDQYFRIQGGSGDQVVCCLSRDSYATGQFLQELMSVLSLQQRAPPPEPSEQDFYSEFDSSGLYNLHNEVQKSSVLP
uniref:PLEKHM2 PH domain-containing protein n=1 Tax=Knipowitschia caucasica TaxID=637954 RepID=A0AAV2KNN5_KNICA